MGETWLWLPAAFVLLAFAGLHGAKLAARLRCAFRGCDWAFCRLPYPVPVTAVCMCCGTRKSLVNVVVLPRRR